MTLLSVLEFTLFRRSFLLKKKLIIANSIIKIAISSDRKHFLSVCIYVFKILFLAFI